MSEELIDQTAAGRFELRLGAAIAFVSYRRSGNVLVLWHAEVPPG